MNGTSAAAVGAAVREVPRLSSGGARRPRSIELRAFFRDKLGLPATDVGDGWLIFDPPEADLGVHPVERNDVPSGTASISFYCDDIEKTMRQLQERGVEFTEPVQDHGYGLVTHFKAPGDFVIQLYQPRYRK